MKCRGLDEVWDDLCSLAKSYKLTRLAQESPAAESRL